MQKLLFYRLARGPAPEATPKLVYPLIQNKRIYLVVGIFPRLPDFFPFWGLSFVATPKKTPFTNESFGVAAASLAQRGANGTRGAGRADL